MRSTYRALGRWAAGAAAVLLAAQAPAMDLQIADLGLREAPRPSREHPGWRPPERILIPAQFASRIPELQEVAPGATFVPVKDAAEAAREARTADVALALCTAEIAASPRLRWIQLGSAGADRCAQHAPVRAGRVLLTGMQRVSSHALADHAMALTLALTRGVNLFLAPQQRGRWSGAPLDGERHWELHGRTMLVVGLGGIGTEVARRADAFGMRVTAIRSSGREGPAFVDYVGLPPELPVLVREADVVVNAAPLTDATRGVFDARIFAAMKPTAYFVNVGRGESAVTADLVEALRAGRIAGAGLDVVDPEPLPADHPLWGLPSAVITPHVAGFSAAAAALRWRVARENLRRWVAGEPLLSVVDPARGY